MRNKRKLLWLLLRKRRPLQRKLDELDFLANAFSFTKLTLAAYVVSLLLAVAVIPIVELVKFIQRKLAK